MARASNVAVRREMTLDEWAALDEDVSGELIDGVLEDEEVPTTLHEAVLFWLIAALHAYLKPRKGRGLGSEHKIAITATRGRKPDLSIYLPGAVVPAPMASMSRTPPSTVIEILSGSARDVRRDRVEKLADYQAAGVRHYWIVDPVALTLEIFELRAGKKPRLALTASEGIHAIPGCPGLSLDLDDLREDVEALLPEEPPPPPSSRPKKRRARS